MQKIPTLFQRGPDKRVIPVLSQGCEWVLAGEGIITIKMDGLCVKVSNDKEKGPRVWRRMEGYDHNAWILCKNDEPMNAGIMEAFEALNPKSEGIYEVFGPSINSNPHDVEKHKMIKIIPAEGPLLVAQSFTGIFRGPGVTVERLFDSIKKELAESPEIEGLVFHLEPEMMKPTHFAKIKRKDFGYPWPVRGTLQAGSQVDDGNDLCGICDKMKKNHQAPMLWCRQQGIEKFEPKASSGTMGEAYQKAAQEAEELKASLITEITPNLGPKQGGS